MTPNPLLSYTQTTDMPPFEHATPAHLAQALAAAMLTHHQEVEAIANSTEPASFSNTVAALDQAGLHLHLASALFNNLRASETSSELQAVEREWSPKLAVHHAQIFLNTALFQRVDAVHASRHSSGLQGADLRLVERLHGDFVRAGARLNEAQRTRLAQIVEALATLTTDFSQTVLAAEAQWQLPLHNEADMAGLPDSLRQAAAAAARQRHAHAPAIITLSRSLVAPFLTHSSRRDLRKLAYNAWLERGGVAPHDNTPRMNQILALRQEQASLLGFANFADYQLAETMAAGVGAVNDLLAQVWPKATALAAREEAQLRNLAETLPDEFGPRPVIEPWDWRYLADKVRQNTYAIDDQEVKPYFSLSNMTAAMFDVAGRLFGISFTALPDLKTYHPDVRGYRVTATATGDEVGVFLADNFSRPTKRGGAWMSAYRVQAGLGADRVRPIIVNNNNFAKAPEGQDTLLSADDVRTLFHEFGHGLHGLLSRVQHRSQSGTSVLPDFVELPSQLMEKWAMQPEILLQHARHVETGEPIADALIAKLKDAAKFNMGFSTVEYAACVLVDLALHQRTDGATLDLRKFEDEQLATIGMPHAIRMRHRLPHFGHLFGSEYYASRYYVYLWAETLDADAFMAFEEAGNLFDPATAKRLLDHVYSVGDSVEPMATYRAFRGRNPEVSAMLRARGLVDVAYS